MNDKRCDVIGTQMKHFEKATILTISTQMKRVGKHTKQYQIAVIKSKESRRQSQRDKKNRMKERERRSYRKRRGNETERLRGIRR